MNDIGKRQAAEQPRVDPPKIRILLIDDDPQRLNTPLDPNSPQFPVMDPQFESWFEFRWLATPAECREFRDLSIQLSSVDPQILMDQGWIPELLAVDYALTQKPQTVAERWGEAQAEHLSPLPALRTCTHKSEFNDPCPVNSVAAGNEYWGCFVGGLMLNTFAEHPCAPVTITRYSPQVLTDKAPDAAFFEWLMQSQSSGLLKASGTTRVRWRDIILPGVAALRRRLEDLAKASIITLSFDDLLALAEDASHPVLTVRSRFGRRCLPTAGLFVDESREKDAAKTWALELLTTVVVPLFKGKWDDPECDATLKDLQSGRDLADELWKTYITKTSLIEQRWLCSQVAYAVKEKNRDKSTLTPEERAALERFGLDLESNLEVCFSNYHDLRSGDYTPRQRRWAALMVIVRLVHRKRIVGAVWKDWEKPEWKGYGDAILKPVDHHDVFFALFPLAQMPAVLPWHKEKRASPSSTWKELKEFSSGESMTPTSKRANRGEISEGEEAEGDRWGDIGLSVNDILKGCNWTGTSKNDKHGFLRGERIIMQWYAEWLYGNDSWEDHPQMHDILKEHLTVRGEE